MTMTSIDRLSSTNPLAALNGAQGGNTRDVATGAISEIGHRALAWVGAAGGGAGPGGAAWATRAGQTSAFRADPAVLAQRGDVYGLGEMTQGIAARYGASPTQEGALRRALEDFTRQAVVQMAGLSGGSGQRQIAGLGEALNLAETAASSGTGIDEVVARVEGATALLVRQNGG
jgi:hypothetical protein